MSLYGAQFNEIHVAAALTQACKLQRRGDARNAQPILKVLRKIDALALQPSMLRSLQVRQVAACLHSLASVHSHDPKLFAKCLTRAAPPLDADAKFWRRPLDAQFSLVHELLQALRAMGVAGTKSQDITMILWALAKLGLRNHAAVETCTAEIASTGFADFTPQALCNVLWALGKLSYQSLNLEDLMVAWMHAALEKGLGDFKSQGLANSIWALAR